MRTVSRWASGDAGAAITTEEDVRWGAAFAESSIVEFIKAARDNIADTPAQDSVNRVRAAFRKVVDRKTGIAHRRAVSRYLSGRFEPRRLNDAIEMLEDMGELQRIEPDPDGRPGPKPQCWRFLAVNCRSLSVRTSDSSSDSSSALRGR